MYPLVMTNIAIENGPVEIVEFPMKNGGSFHSYVKLPEGNQQKLDLDIIKRYGNGGLSELKPNWLRLNEQHMCRLPMRV